MRATLHKKSYEQPGGYKRYSRYLEQLGQLLGGIGHRPVVVRDTVHDGGLIGVNLPDEIGVIPPPHVDGALAGSAVVGGVNRLVRHPPIVPQIHPAGLLHRPAAVVAGGSDTHVGLTVSGVAQVEALALVLARLELSIGVAAGANRLGFQCLQGP